MRGASRLGGALLIAGLALGGAGCSQTTSQAVSQPVVVGGPLVLNSAPGSTIAPAPVAPVATTASPPGTVAATALAPAPAPVAAKPVAAAAPVPAAAKPLPVAAAAPAPAEAMPTTAPDPAAEGSFPNINAPPTQPGGTLLPAEERARIIAELEALKARQDAGAGGSGSSGGGASNLANQAETHGQDAINQIEACSEEGALQNNPACAATD